MTEKFGIEWCDHEWIEIVGIESSKLFATLFQEVDCMRVRGSFRGRTIVQLLRFFFSSDAIVFNPGEFSDAARHWAQMFHRKVETDVAIKFAISRMPRVTFFRAPDLPARISITRKSRGARGGVTRRVNGPLRLGIPKKQAVRVEDEPAEIRFL